ncbi:hypothetical protein ABEB36_005675 [Hypothenemus hampei]|uniref:Uncharacterized protein n=1 Tax=Hypothenemus hampei TaxID=57062 RepID=A0ABD1EZ56_HYPHA
MHEFAKDLYHSNDCQNEEFEHRNFCEIIHIGIVCSGYNSNVHFHALLKSLFLTRSNPLHLHLLVSNESELVLNQLLKTWQIPRVNISYYNINKWLKDVRWVPNGHYSGHYGLLKLIFNKIIPSSVTTNLLILDTDLIITEDVYFLWKLFDKFNNNQMIGIGENQSPYYLGQLGQSRPWPALGTGFNSGVMLHDLKKLTAFKWNELWVNLTKNYTQFYGQTDLGDQDILNAIIKDNSHIFYQLPCYWNVQMSSHSTASTCYSKYKPRILHWNSPQKYSIGTPDGKIFRAVADSIFRFNGNLLRNYPQMCVDDLQNDYEIELSEDQCQDYIKPLNSQYRTLLFFTNYKFNSDKWDITYVTHLSFDRIHLLEKIAKLWPGPISFTLYVSDSEFTEAIQLISKTDALSLRTDIAYHAVFKQNEFYPINTLRNVGLKNVKTPYSFLVDVDFIPMKSLFEILKDEIKSIRDLNNKALVIPAFEPTKSNVRIPMSKAQLIESLDKKEIRPFLSEIWAAGHAPTDYERWRKEFEPYTVKWQTHYEPYVVVKSNVTLYDERFLGFGWNKLSHIMELEAQKYQFIVLSDVFIIHSPHKTSGDNEKFKHSIIYNKCLQLLKQQFIQELSIKYNKNFTNFNINSKSSESRMKRNVKFSSTTSLYDTTDYFLTWGGKEKAERKIEQKIRFNKRKLKHPNLKENLNTDYYYYYESYPPYNITVRWVSDGDVDHLKEYSSEEHNYEYDEEDEKFRKLHDSTTTPDIIKETATILTDADLISAEKNFTFKPSDEKVKNIKV